VDGQGNIQKLQMLLFKTMKHCQRGGKVHWKIAPTRKRRSVDEKIDRVVCIGKKLL